MFKPALGVPQTIKHKKIKSYFAYVSSDNSTERDHTPDFAMNEGYNLNETFEPKFWTTVKSKKEHKIISKISKYAESELNDKYLDISIDQNEQSFSS